MIILSFSIVCVWPLSLSLFLSDVGIVISLNNLDADRPVHYQPGLSRFAPSLRRLELIINRESRSLRNIESRAPDVFWMQQIQIFFYSELFALFASTVLAALHVISIQNDRVGGDLVRCL